MRERIVWVDGMLRPESESHISPFDHGILTGDGVFETLVTYRGTPFAWTRHDARLRRSSEAMGLAPPAPEILRAAASEVMEANGLDDARLRITVTGGPAPLGSDRGDAGPTTIVAATAFEPWPTTVDVVTSPWPRNERGALAGLKTISYGENVRALAHARALGGGEAVFADLAGNLCEGTGTNVWLVRDGEVLETPALTTGCLDGVTRQLIIEIVGPDLGLDIEESVISVGELATAREAFVSSSTREAQAIARVDGTLLPQAPGPVTAAVAQGFRALVARDLDP